MATGTARGAVVNNEIFLAELALRIVREGVGPWMEDGLRMTEAEWGQLMRLAAQFQQPTEAE